MGYSPHSYTESNMTEQLTLSLSFYICKGFPSSSVGKECACNAGVPSLIPGLEGSPGEGNSNPLQYSCLRNPMDRGAWQATVHGVTTIGHNLVTKQPPPPLACENDNTTKKQRLFKKKKSTSNIYLNCLIGFLQGLQE